MSVRSDKDSCGDQDDGCIAKLRGLPWSATADDILKFFKNSKILNGKSGVHMTSSREGRPSGEAFVEFETDDDLQAALCRDREHMGSRYIEVFKVNRAEMDWVVKRSGPTYGFSDDGCVRLRGLPFGCSKEEIAQFFTGLEIVPNGISLLTDYSGRSSGEAFVQFANKEVAEKALLKHREKIGHRYIEIFRSSLSEVNSFLGYSGRRGGSGQNTGAFNNRPSPYDRGDRAGNTNRFQSRGSRNFKDYGGYDRWSSGSHNGDSRGGRSPYEIDSWGDSNNGSSGGGGGGGAGGGSGVATTGNRGAHCVHMRGLPFKATAADITDFFKPLVPSNVRLLQDHSGRASGEADVEFTSHDDAMRAMNKDKGHMQHRYIELFLNSAGSGSGGGSTGGNGTSGGGSFAASGRRRF